MKRQLSIIAAIAYRDLMVFVRDKAMVISSLIFPMIFIGILGSSLQSNLSDAAGYSFLVFAFTGVLAQTMFQSAAQGVISLNEEREQNLVQEIFVSPISRYSIIVGKIVGETIDAIVQGIAIILFGFIIGIPISLSQLLFFFPTMIIAALVGGAFGILVLSRLKSQRSANQIFPFILFPQFFLAGVFSPVKNLPWYIFFPSRISPMTYAVDFVRSIYYAGKPEYSKIVLFHPAVSLAVLAAFFVVFVVIGTFFFVRNERNR